MLREIVYNLANVGIKKEKLNGKYMIVDMTQEALVKKLLVHVARTKDDTCSARRTVASIILIKIFIIYII